MKQVAIVFIISMVTTVAAAAGPIAPSLQSSDDRAVEAIKKAASLRVFGGPILVQRTFTPSLRERIDFQPVQTNSHSTSESLSFQVQVQFESVVQEVPVTVVSSKRAFARWSSTTNQKANSAVATAAAYLSFEGHLKLPAVFEVHQEATGFSVAVKSLPRRTGGTLFVQVSQDDKCKILYSH